MKAVQEEIFGPVVAAAPFTADLTNYLETKTVVTDLS
jgi:hypothetical protein